MTMQVEVVAPEGKVWAGEVTSVLVRTTEGDIGILTDHEPVMAAMVPCAAEIVVQDGSREVIAVGGGFISVYKNRVSLLTDSATLAQEISLDAARQALAEMKEEIEGGDLSESETHRYHQLESQVKAGERYQQVNGNHRSAV